MSIENRTLAVGAQGPDSPAFRIRTGIVAEALAGYGVEVTSRPLFTGPEASAFAGGSPPRRARILLNARRRLSKTVAEPGFDTVLIQRQIDLLPFRQVEKAAMTNRRVVLDVDDAIWLDTEPSAGGHRLAFLKDSERKARWLAGCADVVIAGNDLLANWFEGLARDVRVIPSLVDTTHIPVRAHDIEGPLVLAWLGSASTAPYLSRIAPALEEFARSIDRPVHVSLVGGHAPPIAGVEITERPWTPANETDLLAHADIGLMPLPDTPWTRGKCAYKALMYMAAGIPVVTDAVGVSADVVGHRVAGLVASPSGGWAAAIGELSEDLALRYQMGQAGRSRAEAEFSVSRWAPELARALRGD